MSATENGWHIKADGYMTSKPSFQKIAPKRACDAIEFRHVITFMKFENGTVADRRTYVPREFLANERAKNKKLRDIVDELLAIAYGYAPYESELDCELDMMRELGI